MLRSLVKQSTESLHTADQQTKQFCQDIHTNQTTGLGKLNSMVVQQTESMSVMSLQMSTDFSTTNTQQVNLLRDVESARTAADNSLSNVSGSVETQKQVVNTTVSGMVTHVHKAVDQACVSVTNTSNAANKILQDVTSATVNMNNSAMESMNNFTEFLDSKGDLVKTDIGKHFQGLSGYLKNQVENIETIDKTVENYTASVLATKVSVTGKTPVKTAFKPLSELPVTRRHEIIKNEVRSNPNAAGSKEVIRASEMNDSLAMTLDQCEAVECTARTSANGSELSLSIRGPTTQKQVDTNDSLMSSEHSKENNNCNSENQENIRPEVLNEMPPSNSKSVSSSGSLKVKAASSIKESAIPSKRSRRNNNAVI